ncbi:hypothetical protein D9758_006882 [Tetrapyrgos nigripes]|uniref:Flavin reductase like domain-containing protein n=1 Tax=Tetrapyrgos nigripes TaxID=182062 RepID=A0A8H5LUT3_9AGAR|nr:hypothetical protein D9758_006882 [Tetrapyrgos nigripes]
MRKQSRKNEYDGEGNDVKAGHKIVDREEVDTLAMTSMVQTDSRISVIFVPNQYLYSLVQHRQLLIFSSDNVLLRRNNRSRCLFYAVRPGSTICIENLPAFNSNDPVAYTQPPNPGWKFGMKVEETEEGRKWIGGEKQGWKRVDTEGEDWMKVYQLMLSGIQPRPIALVSSVSENGVCNLAPFSWFNAVAFFPPLVSYSAMNMTWETDGTSKFKDSVENVKATKEFTVNIISIPWAALNKPTLLLSIPLMMYRNGS